MASRRGAEDARNHLPELLESAERGISTIITKRGRAVAVLAPADALQKQGELVKCRRNSQGHRTQSEAYKNFDATWTGRLF